MKKQILLNTDLELSNLCYGTANFGEKLSKETSFEILDKFVDAGGNFIDTANVYCRWVPNHTNTSEQFIGEWLKSRNAQNKVIVATKGGHYDLKTPKISRINKTDIEKDIDESLQTLGLDVLDFYWLHRDNLNMPMEELLEIMDSFVKSGKIRYYGGSNFKQSRLEEARILTSNKNFQGFSGVSNQWSMAKANFNLDPSIILMDEDFLNWHKKTEMPIVPFTSSANGYFQKLYDKTEITKSQKLIYANSVNKERFKLLCKLQEETGYSIFTLSIAWLLNQSFQVFPVSSVTKIQQLDDFILASELKINF